MSHRQVYQRDHSHGHCQVKVTNLRPTKMSMTSGTSSTTMVNLSKHQRQVLNSQVCLFTKATEGVGLKLHHDGQSHPTTGERLLT